MMYLIETQLLFWTKQMHKLLHLWMLNKPSAGTAKEWRIWREEATKKYPIRYFLQETVPLLWAIRVTMPIRYAYWDVMHRVHPKHRYHVIKPRTLEPNYHDPREVILHASMELLTQFVEFEKTKGHTDWEGSDHHAIAWKEMNEVYDWWTIKRPVREAEFDKANPYPADPSSRPFMWMFDDDFRDTPERVEWSRVADLHNQQEEDWDNEDNDYLHRLIVVRLYMWH